MLYIHFATTNEHLEGPPESLDIHYISEALNVPLAKRGADIDLSKLH